MKAASAAARDPAMEGVDEFAGESFPAPVDTEGSIRFRLRQYSNG